MKCISVGVLSPGLLSTSFLSTPAAEGGSLSKQVKKGVASTGAPEQNRAEGFGSNKVPFWNFADAFAALLQEASGTTQIAAKQAGGEPLKAPAGGQQSESLLKGTANLPLLPTVPDLSPAPITSIQTAEKVAAPTSGAVQSAAPASPNTLHAEGTGTTEQVHLFEQPLWLKPLGDTESPLPTPPPPQNTSSDVPASLLSAATAKKKPAGSATVHPEQGSGTGASSALQEAGFNVPGPAVLVPGPAAQVLSDPLGGLERQPDVPKQQRSSDSETRAVSSVAQNSFGGTAISKQTGIGKGPSAVDSSGPELQVTSTFEKSSETKAFSLSLSAHGADQGTTEKTLGNDAAKPAKLPTPQLLPAADSNQASATPSNPRKGGESDLSVGGPSLQPLGIFGGAKDGNPEGFQKKENGKGSDLLSDGSVPTRSETQQVGPSTAANFKEVAAGAQSSHWIQPTDIQGSPASGSTKELVVRLQGQSGETISVRLTDHGGQLQVAVRSSDPAMAATLRQDLPSLTSNLDRIGWKTDINGFEALANAAPAHDPQQSGGDSNSDSSRETPDWEQQSRRQKDSTPDLWDEALDRQSL